jgi:hypothetical protein
VLEEGVRHVMGVFFRHYTTVAPAEAEAEAAPAPAADRHTEEMGEIVAALCDAAAISRG